MLQLAGILCSLQETLLCLFMALCSARTLKMGWNALHLLKLGSDVPFSLMAPSLCVFPSKIEKQILSQLYRSQSATCHTQNGTFPLPCRLKGNVMLSKPSVSPLTLDVEISGIAEIIKTAQSMTFIFAEPVSRQDFNFKHVSILDHLLNTAREQAESLESWTSSLTIRTRNNLGGNLRYSYPLALLTCGLLLACMMRRCSAKRVPIQPRWKANYSVEIGAGPFNMNHDATSIDEGREQFIQLCKDDSELVWFVLQPNKLKETRE
jgi:hypothetical protein